MRGWGGGCDRTRPPPESGRAPHGGPGQAGGGGGSWVEGWGEKKAGVQGGEAISAEAGWRARVPPATPNLDASSEGGEGLGLSGRPFPLAGSTYPCPHPA